MNKGEFVQGSSNNDGSMVRLYRERLGERHVVFAL